jgi:hypothetical protein
MRSYAMTRWNKLRSRLHDSTVRPHILSPEKFEEWWSEVDSSFFVEFVRAFPLSSLDVITCAGTLRGNGDTCPCQKGMGGDGQAEPIRFPLTSYVFGTKVNLTLTLTGP